MAVSCRPLCAPRRAQTRRKSSYWQRPRFRPHLELLESRTVLSSPGSLNLKFGTGGLVTTSFGGGGDFASAVVTQSDGKIVVVGTSASADFSTAQLALVRYINEGS